MISLLALSALVSIFGQVVLADGFTGRDLMVVLRYVVYLAALYAGVATALAGEGIVLRWVALCLVGLAIIISFMQYFNIGGLNSTIVPYYSVADRYAILESGESWRRIIGTMGNPNYWGFILGLGFIYSSYMCLQKQYRFFGLALLFFLSIIMSGSRTGITASFAAVIIGFLSTAITQRRLATKFAMFTLSVGLLVGSIYLAFSLFSENYYDAQDRFSISNLGTLRQRMLWWVEIYHKMAAQPYAFVIGFGPDKLHSVRFSDNMYVRYFRDFGLIGLVLYLVLLLRFLTRVYRLSNVVDGKLSVFIKVTWLGFVQLAVFDLAADGWFNVRITELLLFSYGLAIGFVYRRRRDGAQHESIHYYS
ncbi:MAG: hypothetical protein KC592_08405 [Nitrospira sp.]|nr:hypothetical protein [Nitrospira sp.]